MVSDWRPVDPQIEIRGRNSIIIQGCRRICEYEDETVKINVGNYNIRIVGSDLRIKNIADGCVRIDGKLLSLDLCC